MQPVAPATPASIGTSDMTATVGFLLTLVSLTGTFFYVHLSNWLREILELQAKYELNRVGDTESRKQGRLECRFQLKRLFNHIPLLISIVVTAFLFLIAGVASDLISAVAPQPLIVPYYRRAGVIFLIIYTVLTLYLLLYGYVVAYVLHRKLKPVP